MDAAFIRRFDMVFELPVPPRSQRARIVQAHCGDLLDAPRLARVADAEHLAPAVVARASTVAHAIEAEVGRAASASAFEHLVSHTLQAQGHRPLPRHDANRLPEVYDPAFLHADADLATLAQGALRPRAAPACACTARRARARPPLATGWPSSWTCRCWCAARPTCCRCTSARLKNIARAFREAEDDALLLIDEVDSFLQDRRGAQRSWK